MEIKVQEFEEIKNIQSQELNPEILDEMRQDIEVIYGSQVTRKVGAQMVET